MKKYLLVLVILISSRCLGQDNIGIKFFGLSFHPLGERQNAHLMPNKLDRNAYFVLNLGAIVSAEKFVYEGISIKFAQGVYADCAVQFGGFSHIGIRFKIFEIQRHKLSGGLGPTLVFRKNWQKLEGYHNPNVFKGSKESRWQYLFLWYGGEFEYKYALNERFDLTMSFVPGYPDLMSLSFGVNYNL
ncbi:conserved exported hypothetical protein [Capnocytophaga canis]|uniref:hypothetical protein n=1 Tax=Capnocytophaga canis TaxID=1848903 RepID=UPI0005898356|nr:hypothetical protein [Capnocytophaga canis]CEN44765.1 conserved exported hypothetical protein [Capnocytophaga canis]